MSSILLKMAWKDSKTRGFRRAPQALSLRKHLGGPIAQGNPSADGFIGLRANAFFPQEKKEHVSRKDYGWGTRVTSY